GVARAREKRERQRELYEEKRQRKALKDEERRAIKEAREDEKLIKEVSGVTTYNFVSKDEVESNAKDRDDIHEINLTDIDEEFSNRITDVKIHGVDQTKDEAADSLHEIKLAEIPDDEEDDFEIKPIRKVDPETVRPEPVIRGVEPEDRQPAPVRKRSSVKRPYKIPPLNLLKKGSGDKSGNIAELKATATKLEEVLQSFGVKVTVTDISKGPSVTRYEMIPETGVKVSKIVSLADDIKLNLAAADIRIEAPIPGKAAIGIEVPNKESLPVLLRDLLEAKEFKDSSSKISFAVGKDLAGKVVVADIAKMPHMLIAGATGSGKSVCINTLIISILYKAHPDEVKLIMIDPKVVELSVYNSIPHLLIPVVTDPKKASAALAWAVTEMNDRYQKFADLGVRDLKGYNEKIKSETDENGEPLKPMYQLVVIVDELADMMMVAGKEVEESICRLAQLARAAGIHLILATQRPSVDVITGLIKANMPSRVAFSVSSGVDSRTILDMNGAEKLLGKGDMLFYPQGYTKPARVQGALITDKEVSDVVDFLKNQQLGNNDEDDEINSVINSKIDSMTNGSGGQGASSVTGSSDNGNVPDEFFIEAGRVIVESGKCSIGMLQRKFKIGFNRAARIMDALSEYNVVGPDEGTKPRTILMSPEEYERFIENL
ncbi:MAG: DNA translocase FtsK, partial [Lachnospiraceae bacterium]|nr:DNA translocase FtsK [Lachnospiraceae bacterium]